MTFDIKAFEDFCRSKPADEIYPRTDSRKCALGQFGFPEVVGGDSRVPTPVYAEAVWNARRPGENTFGALADRLSKLREGQSA